MNLSSRNLILSTSILIMVRLMIFITYITNNFFPFSQISGMAMTHNINNTQTIHMIVRVYGSDLRSFV